MKWSDGTTFSVKEALDGITRTLPFRTLGKRIRVARSEVIDDTKFTIHFESEIGNLTGVLREALSTNARTNRIWPVKAGQAGTDSEVMFRFPFRKNAQGFGMEAFGKKILISGKESCVKPDASIFGETLPLPMGKYLVRNSPVVGEGNVKTNTVKLSPSERARVIKFVRAAIEDAPKDVGYILVDSFYLPGEPGYNAANSWKTVTNSVSSFAPKYRIACEVPILKVALENYAKKNNVQLEIVPLPGEVKNVDALVSSSTIQDGRHIFMQDALDWPNVREFMKEAPKTTSMLKFIANTSAATRPPDAQSLSQLEGAAIEERSIAPIVRKFSSARTEHGAPVCLDWTIMGELTFSRMEHCVSAN